MAKTKKVAAKRPRQPAKSRLPVRSTAKRPISRSGRRARQFSLYLTASYKFQVSFRRFRTSQARRSKRKPQIVIPIPFLATREVAITRLKSHRRQAKTTWPTVLINQLKLAATLPLLAGALGLAYFGPQIRQQANIKAAPAGHVLAASTVASPKTMPASTPVRLRIDKIGVSAPVIGLGLASDGSLDTPPMPDEVGWYTSSPTPGQLGPAVIDGHVDWINNIAVFWRLRELVPGDTFTVDRADGSTATFKVTAIQEFPQDSFPSQAVYGNINYAGIRLITCGGQFNTDTHHYNQNIVVFGSLL